jgi:hypothetical protein
VAEARRAERARELDEPDAYPTDRVTQWAKQLHALNNYFEMWPSDGHVASATRDELFKRLERRDVRRARLRP